MVRIHHTQLFESIVEMLTRDTDYQLMRKLEKMTVENGCTPAEAETAKQKLEKLREKQN